MKRPPIRVLDVAGSPEAMGVTHGRAFAEEIRHYTAERVALVASGLWSGGPISDGEVLEVAEATLPAHERHSPQLYAEMIGIATGAGITPAEAVVVGGFTDFVDTVRAVKGGPHPATVMEDDCTAVVVPDERADGAGFYAQTWDMHDTATKHVLLLRTRPDDGPAALVFTTTGCLGQLGMNEEGLCVGINNLTADDGQIGVTWPSVVRDALAKSNAKDGLVAIEQAPLAGGHNFMLFDRAGDGYNIEAMPTARPVTELTSDALTHTNHTLEAEAAAVEGERAEELNASSTRRLATARQLLDRTGVTADDLMELTREPEAICQVPVAPYFVETSGAAVMRPKTLDFWATWGPPSHNEFQHIGFASTTPTGADAGPRSAPSPN
ncbi:MAG: C45 family autoproteolytic acyltransferase/hydrolase [Acidimicrobiales bacterium]